MIAYAGIGSRKISVQERRTIIALAQKLRDKFVVYTGNADGADAAFRDGSKGNCVLILPWENFNQANKHEVLASCTAGQWESGVKAVEEFHPIPDQLSMGAKRCLARNYYQIAGFEQFPEVQFVVCCSNPDGQGGVWGGTGHTIRIAQSKNIPFFNIREEGWREKLEAFLAKHNL